MDPEASSLHRGCVDLNDSTRAVGVVCLPKLANLLRHIGFRVVGGGDDARGDVHQIRDDADQMMPILVGNPQIPVAGVMTFVAKTATAQPVLLINLGELGPISHPAALVFNLPGSVADLVACINKGLPPISRVTVPADIALLEIAADGTCELEVDDTAAAEAPQVSPWERFSAVEETPTVDAAAPVSNPPVAASIETPPAPALPNWMAAPQGNEPASVAPPALTVPAPTPVVVPPVISAPPAVPAASAAPPAPMAPTTEPPAAVFAPAPTLAYTEARIDPFGAPAAVRAVPTPVSKGKVLIVMAAKGGVAKTTTSRLTAQRAAAKGLRTVLVDGNGGQDGQRKMLRLPDSALPSIYDYAVGASSWRDVVITPEAMNSLRPARLDPALFAAVLAPPSNLADHAVVTPAVYADMVEQLRTTADLVVVDTQMVEAPQLRDPGSFASRFIVHLAANSGANIMALFDNNRESYGLLFGVDRDAVGVLAQMMSMGVPRESIALACSLFDTSNQFDPDFFRTLTAPFGFLMGHMTKSADLEGRMNAGAIEADHPSVVAAIDATLRFVTGNPVFDPAPPTRRSRSGLFGRGKA